MSTWLIGLLASALAASYAPMRVQHCAPYWPATWATCQASPPPSVTLCDPYAGLVDGCYWVGRTASPYGLTPPLTFEVGARYEGDGAVLVTIQGSFYTEPVALVWTARTDDDLTVFIPAASAGVWRRVDP